MNLKRIIVVVFLVLLCAKHSSFAQDTTSSKYPMALLVQLSSEQNRIKALEKANRNREAEMVKDDAKRAAQAMINDFKDHFDYCPVYYYVDTNIELIKQKQFEGVLMDTDGNVLKGITPQHYAVVWYGYPITQSAGEWLVKDSTRYTYDPQSRSVKGLVIVDSKFRQIGYLYKFGYYNLFMRRSKYYYSSKRFDIEYMRTARTLNDKLHKNKHVRGTL